MITTMAPNPLPAKVAGMTLQLRGMFRIVQDNRWELEQFPPGEIWDLTLAAVQLAQALKLLAGELD